MKPFLITTTNSDKYETLSELIRIILPYTISFHNLEDAGIKLEIVEKGSILERAEQKANETWKYLNEAHRNNFFISIGIDDGFSLIKDGKGDPDSKTLTDKILSGKYLKQKETIWLKRGIAYCNDHGQRSILTSIPFVFLGNPHNVKRQEGFYSLRKVLAPVHQELALDQMEFDATIQYYLHYCRNDLKSLFSKIKGF
jgi:hypothetical protein